MVAILGRKRWQIAPPAPPAFLERLQPLPPLVAQILYNRGLTELDEVTAFLAGDYPLNNPFLLADTDKAVTLIRQAITQKHKLIVYGDYDVDGVTAAAVLVHTLRSLGGLVEAYIPSRADEGYGLNPEAIASLAEQGVSVLITVDCGVRSLEEVALARRLGLTIIVTDHHHVGAALPQADAVLNPKRPDCAYPFKELAGVGVAYKLAQALLRTNAKVPLRTTRTVLPEAELLDLVALGTVADMVPLLGENHALVLRGLEQLNRAQRPGLSALMEMTDVQPGKVTAQTIGFVLAPRLNAAGRISDALTALELLLAEDMTAALPLAQELDTLNQDRRLLTAEVQERARAQIADEEDVPALLFASSAEFPQGVVGLAASRLLDEFYRPAVVVAEEGELSKGSARSIPEFHITEALDMLAPLLVRYGGHAAAAGFTVRTELLPELAARLLALAQQGLEGLSLAPLYNVDADIPLHELSRELFHELERLQPFGYGNPTPMLVSRRARVRQARAVGAEGRHLKLTLADDAGGLWDAIAFRQGAWIGRLPALIDIVYVLELNEWNGQVNLQLNVRDIHAGS